MARMQGFGRKREEEEERKRAQQQAAADNPQNSAVIRGREHAKETAGALKQTGHKVVAEQKVNPFEQTAGKTNAQLLADYDAEMAGREGMAMGMTPRRDLGTRDVEVDFSTIKNNKHISPGRWRMRMLQRNSSRTGRRTAHRTATRCCTTRRGCSGTSCSPRREAKKARTRRRQTPR